MWEAPLSATQRRIWFAEQLDGTGSAYVLPFALRLRGRLRIARLESSLRRCVAEHAALRTAFARLPDSGVGQHVVPAERTFQALALRPRCAKGRTTRARRAAALALAGTHLRRPMDLAQAPLLRPALFRIDEHDHLLALPLHHLIADGFSLGILHRDLVGNYDAAPGDRLRSARAGYLEFASQNDDAAAAEALTNVAGFFRDAPSVHAPIPDRPRCPDSRGHDIRTRLSPKLDAEVRKLAEYHDVSTFTVYCAVLHLLLVRHDGNQDSVLGFMSANRLRPGTRSVMGPFAAPLPHRVDCSGDPTVDELLVRTRTALHAAAKHNELRMEELVGELGLVREPKRHPLFQVLLNQVPLPEPLRTADGLRTTPVLLDGGTSWLDLELSLLPAGNTTELHLKAKAEPFDRATAARLLDQFRTGLRAVCANPALRLSEVPLLPRRQRREVLAAGIGPSVPEYAEGTLQELLRNGLTTGSSPAVITDEAEWDRSELVRRVTSLATFLRREGIGPDTVVAVCAPRSFELLVALLGTALAGGAYLPLDPGLPPARRDRLLAETGAAAVLVTAAARRGFGDDRPVHLIEQAMRAPSAPPAEFASQAPAPDDMAYLLHTSGSSGAPKAVVNTQRGVHNRLLWMRDEYEIGREDRLLHKTPVTFDVSVWEIFLPFTVGATLVLARPDGHRDPEYLASALTRHAITVVHFVPSMLRAFLETTDRIGDHRLRHVFCSGEELAPHSAAQAVTATHARVHNLYGPTEAAIDVTAHECDGHERVVPIGRAMPNTRVHVLDDHGALAPFDVVGELYLGGAQLARGYHGMPELTAHRFVPDPTGLDGRLYRTGDLGRMHPNGDIEFVGRRDRQTKLRGMRIEPGEVEAALEELPAVRRALCRVIRSDDTDRLVAYVLSRGRVTESELHGELTARLPAHLVPTRYFVLDDVPLLPNGKIDEAGLCAATPAPPGGYGPTPARTAAENLLLPVARRVLHRGDLGRDESFFAAGGDSLLAVRLVAEAAAVGLELRVEDVLRHPVLAELAAAARRRTEPASAPPTAFFALTGAERAALGPGIVDAFPLGTTLTGLVIESQRGAGYRAYVTSALLAGPCPLAVLRQTLHRVTARHPTLRSALLLRDGTRPLHVVHRSVEPMLDVRDLRDRTPESAAEEVDEWLRTQEHHRITWSEPPLFRVTAHLLPQRRFRLTLIEPILDGWSATTVLTELLSSADARDSGGDSESTERVQREFVRRELAALADPQAREFWRDRVRGCPVTRLPLRPAESTQLRVPVPIEPEISAALLDIVQQHGVPLKSVLLAAHVRALSLLAGQRSVGTGVLAGARPETRAAPEAVGLFLNTALLGIDLPGGSWKGLIDELRAAEATALAHRAFPYVEALREAESEPPTDAVFNYTHFHPYHEISAGGDRTVLEVWANDQTYFPLTAQFRREPTTGAVELMLELRTADHRWGERIAALYQRTLEHLAGDVRQRYDVDLVPDDPALFGPRGLGSAAIPASSRLPHDWFTDLVDDRPDETALVVDGRMLPRSRLAAEIAHRCARLRDLGIGTGDRVGVHLPRSAEQVATLLAVLSAGAVYVPLDTALPKSRTADLLEVAGCAAVCDITGIHPGARPTNGGDQRGFGPESPACLLFTSGSTGRPKGALLPHRALSNRLSWGWRELPYRDGEVVLARTPIGFVDALAEVLSPLLGGIPVALLDDSHSSPAELVDALSAVGSTRVTLVPALLAEVLRLDLDLLSTVPRLRTWMLSGEPLPSALVRQLLDRMPHAQVYNLYGCTEVTADVTAYRAGGAEQDIIAPIGVPIDGCAVTPLDPWGHPSIPGVPGELAVSGAAVAIGYDHADSASRGFVVDSTGSTSYRTGDLAVLGADGVLRHLGRTDRQCLVRGVRLDPAEIEEVLRADPGVLDAVVDQQHGELRACVRPTHGGEVRPRRLRDAVRHRLSRSAVPSRFGIADSWPRTATGKVDVRAVLEQARWMDEDQAGQPPASLMECTLAELWATHLGHEEVRRHDDFFALGGQSLTAMVLAGDLRRRLDLPVGVRDIFDHPVLAELAALLEERFVAASGQADTTSG